MITKKMVSREGHHFLLQLYLLFLQVLIQPAEELAVPDH